MENENIKMGLRAPLFVNLKMLKKDVSLLPFFNYWRGTFSQNIFLGESDHNYRKRTLSVS